MDVDPVQERTGNLVPVVLDLSLAAATFAFLIAKIATLACMQDTLYTTFSLRNSSILSPYQCRKRSGERTIRVILRRSESTSGKPGWMTGC